MAVMKALVIDGTTYETVGSASVTQTLSSGTKIGSVTIDGTTTDLYAPTASGGSEVSVTQTLSSGTAIGSITVDDTTTTLYAPTATSVSVSQTLSSGEEIGSITVGSTTTTLYAPSSSGSSTSEVTINEITGSNIYYITFDNLAEITSDTRIINFTAATDVGLDSFYHVASIRTNSSGTFYTFYTLGGTSSSYKFYYVDSTSSSYRQLTIGGTTYTRDATNQYYYRTSGGSND